MKKKEKKLILIILVITMTVFVSFTSFSLIKNYKYSAEQFRNQVNECKEILKSENISEKETEHCEMVIATTEVRDNLDFNYIFGEIMKSKFMILSYFMPILISIPALIWIGRLLKTKSLSNYFLRENKNKFLIRLFKEAYSYIGIFIYGVILTLIICLLTCEYDPIYSASKELSWWQYETIKYLWVFIPLYLLNIFFYLAWYINISLIYLKKFHNYIIAIIGSYLSVMAFELVLDLVFRSNLLLKLFPTFDFTFLNAINTFGFEDQNGWWPQMLFVGICFGISLLIVIKLYGNKEKLLSSNERKVS